MHALLPVLLAALQEPPQGGDDAAAGLVAGLLALGIPAFVGGILCCVFLPVAAGMWKTFEKAGQPGWAALVPIYNIIVLLEIVNRPLWWAVLLFLPCANIIAGVIIQMDVAKAFGKDALWGIGLAFLGFVFWPMLGFGDARYQRPIR